jgi:hypothetical protein
VRDVAGEPPLQPGHVLESPDLALQAAGHLVERLPELRDVVGAPNPDALRQISTGKTRRRPGRDAHRTHDLAGDDHRDHRDEQHEAEPRQQHGSLDEREGVLLGVEREQVVDLEQTALRLDGLADDQTVDLSPVAGRGDA